MIAGAALSVMRERGWTFEDVSRLTVAQIRLLASEAKRMGEERDRAEFKARRRTRRKGGPSVPALDYLAGKGSSDP